MTYLPIEDYGLIGNMRTVALVGKNGSIDWFCPEKFDGPALFAAILDDQIGGHFQICAQSEQATLKQSYLPDTNVLMTRFLCEEGTGSRWHATDHVHHQRRTRDNRNHPRPPERVQGSSARASWKRSLRSASTGYLRRVDGQHLPLQQVWRSYRLFAMATDPQDVGLGQRELAAHRLGHWGDSRCRSTLHLLEPDDVGGDRQGHGRAPLGARTDAHCALDKLHCPAGGGTGAAQLQPVGRRAAE